MRFWERESGEGDVGGFETDVRVCVCGLNVWGGVAFIECLKRGVWLVWFVHSGRGQ